MHPYLTPEKIEQLALSVSLKFSFDLQPDIYNAAKAVLEREANPPPKAKVFTITVTRRTESNATDIDAGTLAHILSSNESHFNVGKEFWFTVEEIPA